MLSVIKRGLLIGSLLFSSALYAQAVSIADIDGNPQRYELLSTDKGMNLYIDKDSVQVKSQGKNVRIIVTSLVVPHHREMIGEYLNDVTYNPNRSIKIIGNKVGESYGASHKNEDMDTMRQKAYVLAEAEKFKDSGMKLKVIGLTFYNPDGTVYKKDTTHSAKDPYDPVSYRSARYYVGSQAYAKAFNGEPY